MNEQLSLFDMIDTTNNSFFENLQDLLDEIILSYELPKNSIHIYSNKSSKGNNVDRETSKSICIYEPDYPSVKDKSDDPGRNFVVMNIRSNDDIELLIRQLQYDAIPLPGTAHIKNVPSDTSFNHVFFAQNDDNIYDYIRENIVYCLKKYRSNARSFGCCDQFIECSDAKKCVHENKLYATACIYRRNLESGRIFYGKNRNID